MYLDYTNSISLVYYTILALFIVLIKELFASFNFSIIPSFHVNSLFSGILSGAGLFFTGNDINITEITSKNKKL